jgi:hypothetical protein
MGMSESLLALFTGRQSKKSPGISGRLSPGPVGPGSIFRIGDCTFEVPNLRYRLPNPPPPQMGVSESLLALFTGRQFDAAPLLNPLWGGA